MTAAAEGITAAMCARGRVLSEPRLSPDGTLVAYVVTADGRASIAVVPVTGGPEVVVTSDPPPPPSASYGGGVFDWTPASDAVVYVGADSLLHYQSIAGGPPRTIVGEGPVSAPAVSPDGTRVAYGRDGRHIAVASLDPDGPWPVRISAAPDFVLDPAWSPDSRRVAWQEWNIPAMPWDDSHIVVAPADGTGQPTTVAVGGPAAVGQPRFAPDGTGLAFLCDAHGWLNVWHAGADGGDPRPLLEEPAEHGGPSWGPGQRSFAWSHDSCRLAFCRNEAGFGRLCVLDRRDGAVRELDRGVFAGLSWVGDHLVAIRSGARTPDQVVVVDTAAPPPGRTTLARGPVAGFEASGLIEPEVVSWVSEDVPGVGDTVHGRLYRTHRSPDRVEGPPLLILVHGGPTGQSQATFNPRVAFFCDRGCNVLMVDYRGSTGWGRAYTQALRGEWGRLDVVDVAAAMRVAAERGWGDARRMIPMGGSAGGLTVLLLLALHPGLCAAGVDLYGVTDLFDLDETTHRFEAHYLRTVVGELPAAADRYRERSPITVAERITSPLLVLQGSADMVVPQAQSDVLVAAVRAAGGTVDYHVYPGEGHGWRTPEVVEDELERTWAFLRRAVLRRR